MFAGFDDNVGDLNEKRLEESTGARDAGRFTLAAALIVARAATGLGSKMLGRWEHGHISADFRQQRNGGHEIGGEARNGTRQFE